MAKFLRGFEVNTEVEKIFREAKTFLCIISPYIKLHPRYKDVLKMHINNDKLQIALVFGKNDGELHKSLSKDEVDFFSKFPNIEIRYEKRLHAKYYANDYSSIITSMNLYDFSQDNNIEVGILMDVPILNQLMTKSLDSQSMDYFYEVIDNSELIFKKEPEYSSGILGIGKKFERSVVVENKIEGLIKIKKEIRQISSHTNGYCIKCHTDIPLKPNFPYCKNCYSEWKKINDKNHQEVFCHICGEKNRSSLTYPACINCYRREKRNLEFPK
jgi:hypothetical protein